MGWALMAQGGPGRARGSGPLPAPCGVRRGVWRVIGRVLLAMATGLGAAGVTQAQTADAPGPVGGVPAELPKIVLPDQLPALTDLRLQVPRTIQAAGNTLGLGRKRLAMVVGIGKVGSRQVLDTAPRDTQAVAAALRAGGFVVMVREDVSGAELRSSLKEFRERLQPSDIGFVYLTGLGAQVGGLNLLVPRDARLDPALGVDALQAELRQRGVPLSEAVDALMTGIESPRLLVVDAAYQHPVLARLPQVGLGAQRVPPGLMALFGHALGAVQEVPAAVALQEPLPYDPRDIAATRFARLLTGALITPRMTGAELMRATRRAMFDGSNGQTQPWLAGETDDREELAEVTLLDALLPRTPEELARTALRQAGSRFARAGSGGAGAAVAGEQGLSALAEPAPPAPADAPTGSSARPAVPDVPAGTGTLGSAAGTAGAAASVAGTVASVAATAATVASVAMGVKAAEASVALSATAAVAGTAVSAAGAVGSNAVALGARLLSGGSAGEPPRQALQAAAVAAARAPVPSRVSLRVKVSRGECDSTDRTGARPDRRISIAIHLHV